MAATPEEFLTWLVENWRTIGVAIFDWADAYPAEPSLPWLRANFNEFWFAHTERADLDSKATDEAREGRRAWRDHQGAEDRRHGPGNARSSTGYRQGVDGGGSAGRRSERGHLAGELDFDKFALWFLTP